MRRHRFFLSSFFDCATETIDQTDWSGYIRRTTTMIFSRLACTSGLRCPIRDTTCGNVVSHCKEKKHTKSVSSLQVSGRVRAD